jgi:CheY-like chemotaxis protein
MSCLVLIVEDDAEVREMMAQMLTMEGFAPLEAGDGLEALEKLSRGGPLPSVILLDMMMPRMDGWGFVERQSQDPSIAGIPVIVVSAAPADRLRTIAAAAVFQKPLDYDRLLAVVRDYCALSGDVAAAGASS